MNHITRPRTVPWSVAPPNQMTDFPVVSNQGINYQMVPLQVFESLKLENRNLKTQNNNLIWLCVGLAAVAIAAGFALFIAAMKPAQPTITVEKPVIIDREVVKPTACLLFCGK